MQIIEVNKMSEVNDILLIEDYTNRDITIDSNRSLLIKVQTQKAVSYTHLTLPTKA